RSDDIFSDRFLQCEPPGVGVDESAQGADPDDTVARQIRHSRETHRREEMVRTNGRNRHIANDDEPAWAVFREWDRLGLQAGADVDRIAGQEVSLEGFRDARWRVGELGRRFRIVTQSTKECGYGPLGGMSIHHLFQFSIRLRVSGPSARRPEKPVSSSW